MALENNGSIKVPKSWLGPLLSAIIALLGVAGSWGMYSSKVSSLETQVSELKQDNDKTKKDVVALQVQSAGVSEKLTNIENTLKEIKEALNRLNAARGNPTR